MKPTTFKTANNILKFLEEFQILFSGHEPESLFSYPSHQKDRAFLVMADEISGNAGPLAQLPQHLELPASIVGAVDICSLDESDDASSFPPLD